jgi:sulfur-oxidizing protein SoxY
MRTNRTFDIDPARRTIIQALAVLVSAPLTMITRWCAAATRPQVAFSQDDVEAAITALSAGAKPLASDKIRIGVARLAENGAVVPLKVDVDLPNVRTIAILATKNPVPLIARFDLAAGTRAFIATRVKLAESSEILALVETEAGWYLARQTVEVTIGGCG